MIHKCYVWGIVPPPAETTNSLPEFREFVSGLVPADRGLRRRESALFSAQTADPKSHDLIEIWRGVAPEFALVFEVWCILHFGGNILKSVLLTLQTSDKNFGCPLMRM